MSRTLNKVQLIGRLGGDPELKYTQAGVPVARFSLATNRQWQGKDGSPVEETDWHNIVAWEKLAQTCSEHLSKGRLVYIEGRIQYSQWEFEGQTRYKTEIIASNMLILDPKASQTAGDFQPEDAAAEVEQRPRRAQPEPVASSRQATAPSRQPASRQAATAPRRSTNGAVASFDEEDVEDLPF